MNLIKNILDGQWNTLQHDIEKTVANKIMNRIEDKKIQILAQLNGVTNEQMKETISLKAKS